MIDPVLEILNQYEPISLNEMDAVKLMDRTDTKFVFHQSHLENILSKLKQDFRVLSVEDKRISRYETLYFDTKDFQFYHRHQTKKLNRYKVRARKYVESDVHFLEVKFKNAKGRTIKERIKMDDFHHHLNKSNEVIDFVLDKTKIESSEMLPVIWVNYSRITLVNNNHSERLTIDVGLNFEWDNNNSDFSDFVIAELKQSKATRSVFSNIMKDLHVREGGFSKYCIGIAALYPHIKQNNFKPVFHFLNKLKEQHHV
jgi:hypothetical protein